MTRSIAQNFNLKSTFRRGLNNQFKIFNPAFPETDKNFLNNIFPDVNAWFFYLNKEQAFAPVQPERLIGRLGGFPDTNPFFMNHFAVHLCISF